jgi:RNA polymerase sigma factor (sigma-70 family)
MQIKCGFIVLITMDEEKRNRRIADFFKTERARLVHYVRRLIDDAADRDGEDIVQDVMVNLFNMADVTVPFENLTAYVYRALRNRVIDIFKKRRADEVSLDDVRDDALSLKDVLFDSRYDTASEAERDELREMLYRAIDSLDEAHRAIVVLTEFEGRSFREISDEWGVPVGTLLSRKSRAMGRIREQLVRFIQ